tara:strand:- start:383 stop:1315 length:933 start_codon:yes stop_codon:yes gene_type:complete
MKKDFIEIDDLTKDEILDVINSAKKIKNKKLSIQPTKIPNYIDEKTAVLLFEKPSLRTKLSFFKALKMLGFNPIYFSPEEIGIGTREKVSDIAKVISKMSDIAILRTFKHATIEEFSNNCTVPVINALTDKEHPCQVIGDLLTIIEETDNDFKDISLTFIGDGNNVAISLAKAFALLGGTFIHCAPIGYEIPKQEIKKISQYNSVSGGKFIFNNKINGSSRLSNFIYTDVWASMGQESEKIERSKKFKDFQVTQEILDNSSAKFMHDLPAHHGEEISDGLLDHPNSIVFNQSENRIWGQVGIIRHIISKT